MKQKEKLYKNTCTINDYNYLVYLLVLSMIVICHYLITLLSYENVLDHSQPLTSINGAMINCSINSTTLMFVL